MYAISITLLSFSWQVLHKRLLRLGLRAFLDERSLVIGESAPQALEAAVRTTRMAVVLLCEEFFQKIWPQRELAWFLDAYRADRNSIIPVFFGITRERCRWACPPCPVHDGSWLSIC